MEKIISITEIDEKDFSGYLIKTTKQNIKLLMETEQQCCEYAGYFISQENFDEFINAEVYNVKLTDDCLNEAMLKQHDINPSDEYFRGGIMFVNIETSKGTLQFTAYNEHNGYYGHEAQVISTQLTTKELL